MKKITEVKVKILSVIENLDSHGLIEGEPERDESERDGFYNYSDGEVEITYSDVVEGTRIESVISVVGDRVTVVRKGGITSELLLVEGEEHTSLYGVPPYSFDVTVRTKRIRKTLDESGGTMDLLYKMSIGGQDKSARMKIWICPNSEQT